MSDIEEARVTLTFGENEIVLIPSPSAMMKLSNQYDGFQPLIQSIQRMNVQACVDTVLAGLDLKTDKERKAMADRVLRQGALKLIDPLIGFVLILANGGRKVGEETAEKKDGSPNE